MIITSMEAITKWCPFVRFQMGDKDTKWQGEIITNRWDEVSGYKEFCCKGQQCIMWEWVEPDDEKNFNGYCGLSKVRRC